MKPTLAELESRDLAAPARAIARAHGLSLEAMFADRMPPAPLARAKFYAVLRDMGWGNATIGRFVGKDHTSIKFALASHPQMPIAAPGSPVDASGEAKAPEVPMAAADAQEAAQ